MQKSLTPPVRAAAAAVRDPEGVRVACRAYGEILGWPERQFPRLRLPRGKEGWNTAIRDAEPLWLGVAWQMLEDEERATRLQRENEIQRARAKGPTAPGRDAVPTINPSTATLLEPGTYPALIREITEETGQYGPQLRLQFVVLDEDDQETDGEIRAWCSAKWNAKSKLYEWAKVILGKKCPEATEAFDTDRLLRRKVDITVAESPGADGQTRTKISAIYPYRTMSARRDDEDDSPF